MGNRWIEIEMMLEARGSRVVCVLAVLAESGCNSVS
jgi:hypothetical protein